MNTTKNVCIGFSLMNIIVPTHCMEHHINADFQKLASAYPQDIPSLIESRIDPDVRGPKQMTALMAACFNANYLCAQSLLHNGADACARTQDGDTPLHFAALAIHNNATATTVAQITNLGSLQPIIQLLHRCGAKNSAKNHDNKRPIVLVPPEDARDLYLTSLRELLQ